jgi:hypothetical protein
MSVTEEPAKSQINQKMAERWPVRAVGMELFCANRAQWSKQKGDGCDNPC